MEVDITTPPKESNPSKTEELPTTETELPANDLYARITPEESNQRVTRSRSKTPQKKRLHLKKNMSLRDRSLKVEEEVEKGQQELNGKDTENKTVENGVVEVKIDDTPAKEEHIENVNGSKIEKEHENLSGKEEPELPKEEPELSKEEIEKSKETEKSEGDNVEMEPLVLNADEPDPELQFDESSDLESGKNSPVITRCKTRRSQTRNIPTPKTVDTDQESDRNSVTARTPDGLDLDSPSKWSPKVSKNLDVSFESIDLDVSTKAEVGSDVTRMNFEVEESMGESYLERCRNRSIRGLSARRSIRSPNDEYLKKALKNNRERSDLNLQKVETIVTGSKRKRSESPNERKKLRGDSSGLISRISSPLVNFKYRLNSDMFTSSPKLTGYKDNNGLTYAEERKADIEETDKKTWCTIM